MSAVVLFVLFFVILLFGLPISVTMGISSILPWVVDNTFAANLVMVLRQMMSGVNSLTLLAIPMFMLSGTIMARGGISKKLFDVFTYFVGNVIGGVPCAVIITCLFYGAISGSAPATVAAVGAMTIVWSTLIGYSIALRKDEHIKMDILYAAIRNETWKRGIEFFGYLCGAVFSFFMMRYGYLAMHGRHLLFVAPIIPLHGQKFKRAAEQNLDLRPGVW